MEINIAQVLGINKLEYLNYRADQFNIWCTMVAEGIYLPKRILQESTSLYNWYCKTWDNQITYFFLPDTQVYLIAKIKDALAYQSLFTSEVVTPIQKIYPSAIIDQLKKEHYAKVNSLSKNKAIASSNEHKPKTEKQKISKQVK